MRAPAPVMHGQVEVHGVCRYYGGSLSAQNSAHTLQCGYRIQTTYTVRDARKSVLPYVPRGRGAYTSKRVLSFRVLKF